MKFNFIITVLLFPVCMFAGKIFEADFNNGYGAKSVNGTVEAIVSGSGITVSPHGGGCPADRSGCALEQQNVARRAEFNGSICYPANRIFPMPSGTVSLWIKRNGGGTYNTFIGAGNTIWTKNNQFNIFYDTQAQKLYFRFIGSIKERLDISFKIDLKSDVWFRLAACWKYEAGKMKFTAYVADAGNNLLATASAESAWSNKLLDTASLLGANGRLWIGSCKNGMTPANSFIDNVELWNTPLDFKALVDKSSVSGGAASRPEIAVRAAGVKLSAFKNKEQAIRNQIVPVPRLNVAPVMDGVVKRDEWQSLTTFKGGFILGSEQPCSNPMKVGMGYYNNMLYIAVENSFAAGKALTAKVENRDGPVFSDDCVEVFICGSDPGQYCHWIINSNGVVFDEKNRKVAWNSEARTAARQSNGTWTAEFLIPVQDAGVASLDQVKINIAKNDMTLVPSQLVSLIPVPGRKFLAPEYFLRLFPLNTAKGIDITHGFVAGPAGQNGINTTITGLDDFNGETIINALTESGSGKDISRQKLAVNGGRVSFDTMLETTRPVVQQVCITNDREAKMNVFIPLRTQAEITRGKVKTAEKKDFPWMGSRLGINDEVPAPFAPIEFDGRTIKVKCREIVLGKDGIIDSVKAADSELLAAPIQIVASGKSSALPVKYGDWKILAQRQDKLELQRKITIGNASGLLKLSVAFDGFIWFDLSFDSVSLGGLSFEVPLRPENIYCLQSSDPVDFSRNEQIKFPRAGDNFDFRFMPYIWLGNEKRGFCITAENDENWQLGNIRQVYQLLCRKDAYICKLNFVNRYGKLSKGAFAWGILPTPVKPSRPSVNMDMAWADIHQPESLLYPLNDSPDQPKDFFDYLVAKGVKQLVLFDYWSRYQGGYIATSPEAVRTAVKKCHERGIKVLLYRSRELSNANPMWDSFSESCLTLPTSYGYRRTIPVKQISYGYCPASELQDYFVWSCDKLMQEYGVDGFYLDGPAHLSACMNSCHNCGYAKPNGARGMNYPVRAARQMIERLYKVVKKHKPDGIIDAHGSFTPAVSFITSLFNGEQFYKMRRYDNMPLKILPLEVFRALYLTNGWGVSSNMLIYNGCPFSPDEANSFAFLHGVSPRPHPLQGVYGRYTLERTAPIWKALNEFGADDASFVPYWTNDFPLVLTSDPASLVKRDYIKVSFYKKGDEYLYLASNFYVHACRTKIFNPEIKGKKYKALNMLTGKPVCFQDGTVWFTAPVYQLQMIRLIPEK